MNNSLIAVFSQTLIPKLSSDGKTGGRVLAQEVMVVTPAIANLVREGKSAQIYSAIQTGGNSKMQTLESSLKDLYISRQASYEDILTKTSRPEELKRLIGA